MPKNKKNIEGFHIFYISFFVAYFFLLYFLLYHSSGFSPFQINIHFFANVVGSLCKRFLGEASIYAFLFFLIHYSRRLWVRGSLIVLFLLAFSLNAGAALYYFVARTNVHWYVIQAFQWNLSVTYLHGVVLFAFLGILTVMIGAAIYLFRLRPGSQPSFRKRLLFLSLFAGVALSGNHFPILYDADISLFANDRLEKMQFRIFDLGRPGIVSIANEIRYEFFAPEPQKEVLTEEENRFIQSTGLEEKLTISSGFHPKKIVLVVLENVSQSFLSYYNSEIAGTTPFVDLLLESNPHLDSFYPSGTYTLFGLADLLCSHLNTSRLQIDDDYECMPSLLKKAGYQTEFIRGFSKYYVHENVFFKKMGYDTITAMEEFDEEFPDFKDERPELYYGWGFSDDYLFDEAIERLKEKEDEPVFLTLLTVDTHATGGRCYRDRTDADYENDVLFSVVCTEELLKNFFQRLDSEGLFDDELLVVITSDHLYSSYSQIPGDTSWDSFKEEPNNIPLIFVSKQPVPLLAQTGSQIDVSPTFLDLLDIEAPDYYMGKSLLANSHPIPMGQDRGFVYMVLDGNFHRFNLNSDADTTPTVAKGRLSDYIDFISDDADEINRRMQALRQESSVSHTQQEQILLKWIKNQW